MKLGNMCEIHVGFTARGRLDPSPKDGLQAIQMRDVGEQDTFFGNDFSRYDLRDLPDRFLVHGGEVIFKSRGLSNTAISINCSLSEPTAVILPLMIIRPDPGRLHSEYLAWAINQPDAQRRLTAGAQGTNIRMVPKSTLEQLEIEVPDLETQKKIAEVDALARHEGSLMRELASQRQQLLSKILNERAKLTSIQRHA